MAQFPPQLSDEKQALLVRTIQDWALGHGLVLRTGEASGSGVPAPVTLWPTPFAKKAFYAALEVQKPYNELYRRVCSDKEWLIAELQDLARYDADFTGRLLEIYLKVHRPEKSASSLTKQVLTGGLFRSDYIVNASDDSIKQVEFNTVSVSFGGLSSKLGGLHRYLVQAGVYGKDAAGVPDLSLDTVPLSPSLEGLAAGLAKMHNAYLETAEEGKTAVLFVVQPDEKNALDQRLVEYELFGKHGIVAFRLTLPEIADQTRTISHPQYGDVLYYAGPEKNVADSQLTRISVVYYRAGYGPGDYPSETEWEARLYLEKSHAIQCPSVLTQLSGAKKIQQLLTDDAVLKKFSGVAKGGLEITERNVSQLKETFVAIYPLDSSPRGLEAQKLAFEHPERFVLKPQREGGGNNIYRDNIPAFLNKTPKESWGAYILMELIKPAENRNQILRAGEVYTGEIISELGVFGSMLWNTDTSEVFLNEAPGWLLRTKLQTSDEGGVAAGFGCIDSVFLV